MTSSTNLSEYQSHAQIEDYGEQKIHKTTRISSEVLTRYLVIFIVFPIILTLIMCLIMRWLKGRNPKPRELEGEPAAPISNRGAQAQISNELQ